jgi:general secretion pathway protein G
MGKAVKSTFCKMSFLFLILVTLPNQATAIKASKTHTTEVLIFLIYTGLDSFRLDIGRYPNIYEGLSALYEKPKAMSSEMWKGPYLLKKYLLTDPWQQDFRYISPGIHNKDFFDLFSIGRDGIEGTIDDINNWDEDKAWVEHYQSLKPWYWSDLLKSWYWYELWSDSWVFRMSLLVSLVFVLFVIVLWVLIRLIIQMVKKLTK